MSSKKELKEVVEVLAATLLHHFDASYKDFMGCSLQQWSFEWMDTMKRIGQCIYGPKIIRYSHRFLHRPVEEIENTLRHEIAHAIAGPAAGHGPLWQAIAIQVGAVPQACSHVAMEDLPARWETYCTWCGEVTRKTASKRKNLHRRISQCCSQPVAQRRGDKK